MTNSKNNASTVAVLAFGDFSVVANELPAAVQHTLMQRTFAHIMGNEAAAVRARHAAIRNDDESAKHNDAELAEIVDQWRSDKIAAMKSGEFSLRQVGPRLSDDEKVLRDIARETIIRQATESKTPLPKASEKEVWEEAIEAFLATPDLRAIADKELERRKGFKAPKADLGSLFVKKAG